MTFVSRINWREAMIKVGLFVLVFLLISLPFLYTSDKLSKYEENCEKSGWDGHVEILREDQKGIIDFFTNSSVLIRCNKPDKKGQSILDINNAFLFRK